MPVRVFSHRWRTLVDGHEEQDQPSDKSTLVDGHEQQDQPSDKSTLELTHIQLKQKTFIFMDLVAY